MTKYAANAMLATRISFINEIANLCEKVGADVSMVRKGIGTDSRIGSKFLYPGPGFGGSCFPKDVKALIKTGMQYGSPVTLLESVEAINERQKKVLFDKFRDFYQGNIRGKKAAIWGLSYKPGTDDMREAPSLTLISQLLEAGCTVKAYDPAAIDEARHRLDDTIGYASDIYDAVRDADVLFHDTEWKEYRMPDWE
jgi:UDPglucose 6-dehydrogenase